MSTRWVHSAARRLLLTRARARSPRSFFYYILFSLSLPFGLSRLCCWLNAAALLPAGLFASLAQVVFVVRLVVKLTETADLNSRQIKLIKPGERLAIRKRAEEPTIPPTKRLQVSLPNVVAPLGWINRFAKDGESEILQLEVKEEEEEEGAEGETEVAAVQRAVVLEVGCGANVRTMRHAAARAATQLSEGAGARVTLVRVNPEYPLCEHELPRGVDFVPLMEGALEATRAIDVLIGAS